MALLFTGTPARGVSVVTDIFPLAGNNLLTRSIDFGGGVTSPEDVVVGARYIYTLALALVGLALATCAILFLMIDF